MSDAKLEPCPHCGGNPYFSDWEWKDDRRYASMEIKCCASIEATLGWKRAREMTPDQIGYALKAAAVEEWNARYDEEKDDLRAQLRTARNDALEEAAKEADRLGQEWWATKLRAMKE